jgi:Flp pilus assembly protein TadG
MKPKSSQRGNVFIEFAIAASVLVFAFAGVFQYGYSMYIYNALQGAVTSAAMYAQSATYDERTTSFDTAIKNMVVYGNTSGTGTRLVPGLATSHVSIVRTPSSGYPQTITVKLNSFTVDAVFRSFTFTNKPNVSVRFTGEYFTSE